MVIYWMATVYMKYVIVIMQSLESMLILLENTFKKNVEVTRPFEYINVNVRENRRGNHEWTIKRHKQHWAQKSERRQIKPK